MTRPTLADVETVGPNNWGGGGGYRIPCDGTCYAYQMGTVGIWGHRFWFVNKREALAAWRMAHPRRNGESK